MGGKMRVIVGCEFSQIVTQAFRKKGHEAFSCDILPTEGNQNWHYQEDIIELLKKEKFDLGIFHPPCTYLSYAATRAWNDKGRVYKRLESLKFFADLWEAPIDKICIENPKGCASPTISKYSQIIQPWYWGEPHYKTTCLWLKNLPLLTHSPTTTFFGEKTHTKPEPVYICEKTGKNVHWEEAMGGGKNRAHNRSKFWPSIAEAMANQWG